MDNFKPKTNQEYCTLVEKLKDAVSKPKDYKPGPLRRFMFEKPGRVPISVPNIFDRCLQALYQLTLEPITEEKTAASEQHSYGFSKGRCPAWPAHALHFKCANTNITPTYVIELDIQGCFDEISHKYLIKNIPINPIILDNLDLFISSRLH